MRPSKRRGHAPHESTTALPPQVPVQSRAAREKHTPSQPLSLFLPRHTPQSSSLARPPHLPAQSGVRCEKQRPSQPLSASLPPHTPHESTRSGPPQIWSSARQGARDAARAVEGASRC